MVTADGRETVSRRQKGTKKIVFFVPFSRAKGLSMLLMTVGLTCHMRLSSFP